MHVDLDEISPLGQVWVFYDDKPWNDTIDLKITEHLYNFCQQWKAHELDVFSSFKIIDKQIIVVVADTEKTQVTGCSKDTLVHKIQDIESNSNLCLFSRNVLIYGTNEDHPKPYTLSTIKQSIAQGLFDENSTYMIDSTIKTLNEISEIKKPLKNSWLMKSKTANY